MCNEGEKKAMGLSALMLFFFLIKLSNRNALAKLDM